MFTKLKLLGLLISSVVSTTGASPLSRIHLKFSQPPHQIQEHGITTDGGRLISQQSYLSFGRRIQAAPISYNAVNQQRNMYYNPINPVQFNSAPTHRQPLYVAPLIANDISYDGHEPGQTTPDFSNGLDYPDPELRTGVDAIMAVKYIYGRGEFFFHEIPHVRLLLRNNQQRRENRLNGNILSSLRPNSPWFRRD